MTSREDKHDDADLPLELGELAKRLDAVAPSASVSLNELHDRLGSMIDQIGQPDYSLRELAKGLREVRDSLFALSHEQPIEPPPCETCHDIPEVCASIPGLRHCEAANREPVSSTLDSDGIPYPQALPGDDHFYEHWLNVLAQECFGDERPNGWIMKLAVRVRELNRPPSATRRSEDSNAG